MSREWQGLAGPYINETSGAERQSLQGPFINETSAATTATVSIEKRDYAPDNWQLFHNPR